MNVNLNRQQGFTLIELVMVIVILGILAATALPKFVNLTGDAETAALNGAAGAASSAMAINYSGCLVTSQVVTVGKCAKVKNCTDAAQLLQGGAFPTAPKAMTTTALASDVTTNGTNFNCTLSMTGSTSTAPFIGIAAGN
jgi:MSHA pilin protein MshA